LRHRRDDILTLAGHFAVKMSGELGWDLFPGFSESARDCLLEYAWPGNVRELKNVIERAVYSSEDPSEAIQDIVFDPFESPWRPGSSEAPQVSDMTMEPQGPYDFKQHLQKLEISLLKSALKQCRFNQKKTADHLGMTYHQLRGYLRKYQLTETDD
jgi:psp operon transcriptional activator